MSFIFVCLRMLRHKWIFNYTGLNITPSPRTWTPPFTIYIHLLWLTQALSELSEKSLGWVREGTSCVQREDPSPKRKPSLFPVSPPLSRKRKCEEPAKPNCGLACPAHLLFVNISVFQAKQICLNGRLLLRTKRLHSIAMTGGTEIQVGSGHLWAK